jgi:signal transduction histidine kinase/ActR/RegA family two-component response regulator
VGDTFGARDKTISQWFARTLLRHPICFIGSLLALGMAVLINHIDDLNWDLAQTIALDDSSLYSQTLTDFRTLYTSEVVERVRSHGVDIRHDYENTPGAIPLPATLSIILGQKVAQGSTGGEVKLYSDFPFPWRLKVRAPMDTFEQDALQAFRNGLRDPFIRFEELGGKQVLRYATADLMRPQCLSCHNTHPQTPRKGWKAGDVRGVLSITRPVEQFVQQARSQLWQTFALLSAILLLTLGLIALVLRMMRAQILANEANRFKTEFLLHMSHEIRTPLNGVIGMTQLLEQTSLTEKQHQYTNTLIRSGHTLLNLVNDILHLSKIEAGYIRLESIPFAVSDLLDELSQLMTPLAMRKGLHLRCEDMGELPAMLWGDPARLNQILTNLLSNAIKFSEQGEVILEVENVPKGETQAEETQDVAQHKLRFTVTDTGIGIPKEAHRTLFDSFTQADVSHARLYGGTGLGLTITKDLVDLMNGQITFESEPGTGTTFWVTIPFSTKAAASRPVSNPQRFVLPTAEIPPQRFSHQPALKRWESKSALIVEDTQINQQVASAMMTQLGFTCDIAEDGKGAVEAAGNKTYHVILMDCQMPLMNGFDATRRIRQIETESNRVPVIGMSAHAIEETRRQMIEAGMDDYIAKPISLAGLEKILASRVKSSEVDTEPI